jgi:hypothetical protein
MSSSPTILKSSTTADFLASLPTLAGRTLQESIVVVPFAGRRTIGLMRLDLPPGDEPGEAARLASVAVGALSRMDACDGVVFAVYTDATFPVAFARWEPLIRCLDERFAGAGFAVKDALCASADGYASWYEADPPLGGHPLSDIESSPLTAQAESVRGHRPLAAPADEGDLPPADPQFARVLTDAVDALCAGAEADAFGLYRPVDVPDGVELIEQVLDHDAAAVPIPLLARLAFLSMFPARRDEMMLQIAFGRAVGERARASSDRWHARQRQTGMSMDEVIAQARAEDDPALDDELGLLMIGDSTRPLKARRTRTGIAVLRRLIAHLDPDQTPDLLCMLAWLHWSIGAGTAAAMQAQRALRIAPDHTMSRTMLTLFGTGKIPEWVYARHNGVQERPHATGRRCTGKKKRRKADDGARHR